MCYARNTTFRALHLFRFFGVEQRSLGIITEKAPTGGQERTAHFMRTYGKRILSALLTALMLALTFTACGKDKPDYEKLKTDIVGMWCDINGPEYFENEGNPYYQIYEFTSDGRLAYHTITPIVAQYIDVKYELRDNFLTVDSSMCKVSVENDVLTMTNDAGNTQFRRMSMEEVCNFGVVFIDSGNYEKQLEYTDFFKTNWPGAAAAAETAAADAAETEAAAEGTETTESLAS